MKKTFSKKVLSLFLSVLMIVTSIPAFAVTVSADTVSAFPTNDLVYFDSGVYNQKNQKIGADYDGTATDSSKGYTLTFTFNGSTPNPLLFGRDNTYNGADVITEDRRYFELFPDGNIHYTYGNSYVDFQWGVFSNLVNRGAVQVVIQIIPSGDFDVVKMYQNGILDYTYDMNTKSLGDTALAGQSIRDYFATNNIGFYANSSCGYWDNVVNDNAPNEYSDVAVFNNILTPNEVSKYVEVLDRDYSSLGSDIDSLKAAMTDYEEVMDVASNLKPQYLVSAYDAYVTAAEICDATKYGGITIDAQTIHTAIYNLTVATDLMTEMPEPTATARVMQDYYSDSNWSNNTDRIEEARGIMYNNVLYAPNISVNDPIYYENYEDVDRTLYFSNNPVILYDGVNTPMLPVMAGGQRNGDWTNDRYYWFIAPVAGVNNTNADSNWTLASDRWAGGSTDPDWRWIYMNQNYYEFAGFYNYNDTNYRSNTLGNKYYWANVLQFNGTPTQVATEYSVVWAFGAGGSAADDITYKQTPVRVINYKALEDAVYNKLGLVNVRNYTSGALRPLLEVIEQAGNIDPQSYFDDGVDRYSQCVSDIQSVIDSINNYQLPDSDSDGYEAVRNILDTEINENNASVYTTYSYTKYREIIDICRAYMAAVYEGYSYNGTTLSSGYAYNSDMAKLADAASNVLNKTIDLTELRELYDTARELDIFNEYGVQTKSLESWVKLQSDLDEIESTVSSFVNIQGENDVQQNTPVELSTGISLTYDRILIDSESSAKNYVYERTQYLRNPNNFLVDLPSDQLEVFDTAYEVGTTVPETVYETDVREEQMNAINNARAEVYMSAEEAKSIGYEFPINVEEQEIAYFSLGEDVDTQTENVLTAITTLDSSMASFSVTVNGVTDSKTYKYGETYKLEGQETNGEWNIKYGENKTINIRVDANTPVDFVVEDNIVAVFNPNVTGTETSNPVYIYNGYGKLIEIRYVEGEVTADYSDNLTYATVPYYDFNGWRFETEIVDGKTIYKFTPKYKAQKNTDVTVKQEGELVKEATFDTAVTLVYNNENGVNVGWVNKTADGKYQIVSYSQETFKFYAISEGNYYPFFENAETETYYVIENGEKITLNSTNVDGSILPEEQEVGVSADDHLNFKIKERYPFIYAETAVVVDEATADTNGRYRVYARFTEGATKYQAYGARIIVGGLDGKFTANSKTDTNQFALTLNLKPDQVSGVDKITFKPYVNHYFMFNGQRVDAFYTSQIDLSITE